MTEERIEQLAKETERKLFPDSHPARKLILQRLISLVAAESRKQGIDEYERAMIAAYPTTLANIKRQAERLRDPDQEYSTKWVYEGVRWARDKWRARFEKAKAELAKMIELEASVCPEDFGCHEYIPVLEVRVKKLIGALESIYENKYEPDKLLILAERLGAVLAEVRELGG